MPRLLIKFAMIGTLLIAPIAPPLNTHAFANGGGGGTRGSSYADLFTRVFPIQRSHKAWFGGGGFGSGAFDPFHQRARHPVGHARDFYQSHKVRRIKASAKPHVAARVLLLDQESHPRSQRNDVPTAGEPRVDRAPDEIEAASPSLIEPEAGETVGAASVNRPADAASPSAIEPEAGQTVGVASVTRSADAAQNTSLPLIERKGAPKITWSLNEWLLMVVVAFGVLEYLGRTKQYLLGRTKRGLVYGAMRGLEPPPDYAHPVDLPFRPPNQIEVDPGAESFLKSLNKALGSIAEAEAEKASSRQLRKPL